ncbi:NUDIX domain-containing protein [Sinisalibacter aestuarii]|uniref:ADP-ribose pyrophosphatase n=1 Tax=Sinisalibacter aestuarii TaxID=2949426 RepID=A0ABQ5LYW2_9RHOB|nr:NUDIX domain-containing protein [Sinisalibacter aestuarii]GKY89823.1 tellurite resistance protein [Sinisalibacter aestuarii]
MSLPLFFYGTLCHAPLREAVLGLGHTVNEARLAGYSVHWAEGSDYPVIVPDAAGVTLGIVVDGIEAGAEARANWFEGGFGYRLEEVRVAVDGRGAVAARVYMPDGRLTPGAPWSLDDWVGAHAPVWLRAAEEAMAVFEQERGRGASLAARWEMMKQRAATALRAQARIAGHVRRVDYSTERDVAVEQARHPHTGYFSLQDHDLRYRRFDGAMSAPVRRAGFVGGDAATVLPWDPELDAVLVVEQFRAGPFFRGDPRPWTLEPIAGRVDPGEDPAACVRREAMEEAGLALGRLHRIADYYPSPGAVSEFVYSFVAEAQLSGRGGELGGMDDEHEDIRTHLIPREEIMALVASGEVATGPLILSLYWLEMFREKLWRG